MKKPSVNLLKTDNFVKIGEAAKILGVSIDTLRRWEKSGKLKAIKTPGGTRLYSRQTLQEMTVGHPERPKGVEGSLPSTEELLRKVNENVIASPERAWQSQMSEEIASSSASGGTPRNDESSIPESSPEAVAQIYAKPKADRVKIYALKGNMGTRMSFWTFSSFTLIITVLSLLAVVNHINPLSFFFHRPNPHLRTHLRGEAIDVTPGTHLGGEKTAVLAASASGSFLEINADTRINGSLDLSGQINGVNLEGTPSASIISLTSGNTTLDITNSSKLNQDVSTSGSPGFNILKLSAISNQLVFQSGGPTGTLTWTPSSARVVTLPDATTTLVGTDTSQTLTNKSLSGSSNTFSSIPNSALSNSKVTISAGTNLTGGGDVSLGSSVTVSLADSVTLSGTLAVTGATTLSSTLSVTGASTLSGNVGVGASLTTTGLTLANGGLNVTGLSNLSGNVGVGGSLTAGSAVFLNGLTTGNGSALCLNGSNNVVTCTVGTGGISGSGTAGGVSYFNGTSSITSSAANFYWDSSNNRLGIGTSAPTYQFQNTGTTFLNGFVGIGSSLNVSGNVGVGGSITGFGALNGLNVTGLTNLGSLNAGTSVLGATTLTANNAALTFSGTTPSITTTGTNPFSIFSQGNVGIGTSGNLYGQLTLRGAGTGTNITLQTYGSGLGQGLTVLDNGNVGVGTTGPGAKLTVTTGASNSIYLGQDADSTNYNIISLNGSLGDTSHIGLTGGGVGDSNLYLNTPTGGELRLRPNGSVEAMRVTSTGAAITGNLSITSTSSNPISIVSSTADAASIKIENTSTSGYSSIDLLNNSGAIAGTIGHSNGSTSILPNSIWIGSRIAEPLYLITNGTTPRLTIDTSGNVGIGATLPQATLVIQGNVGIGYTGANQSIPSNGLAVSGNVGIGTTTASHNLEVIGTGNFSGNLGIGGSLTVTSLLTANAGIATNNLSDTSLTSGSVVFAGANGILSQNNSNFFWDNTSNRLGIGTASPVAQFDQRDTGTGTTLHTYIGSSAGQFGILDNGNVGIGTSSPSQLLDVNGTENIGTNLLFRKETNHTIQVSDTTNDGVNGGTLSLLAGAGLGAGSTGGAISLTGGTGQTGGNITLLTGASTAVLNSGNITINSAAGLNNGGNGGSSGSVTLGSLAGGNSTAGAASTAGASGTLTLSTGNGGTASNPGTGGAGGNIAITAGNGGGTSGGTGATGGNISLTAGSAGSGGNTNGSSIYLFPGAGTGTGVSGNILLGINSSGTIQGNVGIGTSTPGSALQVNGAGIIGFGAAPLAAPTNGLYVGGNVGIGTSATIGGKLAVLGGNVGIGTSSPNSLLSVAGGAHIGSVRQGISAPTDGLFVDGNVGIGATTSSNKLDVWGNSRISGNLTVDSTGTLGSALIGYSGVTAPSSGLAVSGNLGVGTTSPLQALQVVGQCVTGDTKLRRRRRKSAKGKVKSEKLDDEWEEVRIDQIRPGDEILTLDEKSGEFIPSEVKGLMDMGKQEVYELITESGKSIQTTKNHPYLIFDYQSENLNWLQKESFESIEKNARKFYFENLAGRKVYSPALADDIHFTEEGWNHFTVKSRSLNEQITRFFALPHTAIVVSAAKKKISYKKVKKLNVTVEYWELQEIIDHVLIKVIISSINKGPKFFLSCVWLGTQGEEGILANKKELSLSRAVTPGRPRRMVTSQLFSKLTLPQNRENVKWIKVQNLKPGQKIATISGWEKIISIKSQGRKQTFDIEIDYTHNFVGNNIVAHNTYINSGLNIGLNFTGGAAVPSNGLAVSGNVGIGTTSPTHNLEVVGTANISGNVGIGGSLTVTSLLTANAGIATNNLSDTSLTSGSVVFAGANGILSQNNSNFFWDNTSNRLGIGTASPVAQFDQRDTGTGATLHTYIGSSTGQFGILDNGNVGIGTSSPATALHILGTGDTTLRVETSGNNTSPYSEWKNSAGSILTIGTEKNAGSGGLIAGDTAGDGIIHKNGAYALQFGTNSVIRQTITSAGNVGIGTTTPNSLLSVAGSAHIGSVRQGISAPTDGLFVDGNVGVGATTSNNKLDVWGNSRIAGNLTVDSAGTLGSALIGYSGVTAPSSGLAVSGNVGVGTTSPLQALHVVGQCVAKGTRIRRRRRRKNTLDGGNDKDEDFSEVEYEITTDTGKTIYALGEDLVSALRLLTNAASIKNNSKSQSQYRQTEIEQRQLIHYPSLVNDMASNQNSIATTAPHVNLTGSYLSSRNGITMEAKDIWPIPTQISDNLFNLDFVNNFIADASHSIAYQQVKVKDLKVGDYIEKEQIIKINKNSNWEDVPVEDIKPDDEILSLNEKTGEFEWNKVEKTMDMGIQEVFRLETESGKWVETTGNHPYLVRDSLSFGRTTQESHINQQYSNYIQSNHNGATGEKVSIDVHAFVLLSLKNTPATNEIIAAGKFSVNNSAYFDGSTLINLGEISSNPNQPEARLIDTSAKLPINEGLETNLFNNLNLSQTTKAVKWIKVSALKIGQYIATINGWEKIVAIENAGRVQTYDLQIASTHNFLAGHYINRKTGKALTQKQEEAYFEYLANKKALISEGSFGSVENSFNEEPPLSTRINNIIPQKEELSTLQTLESRRGDLHSHPLVDKTGIPLHELRRQTATRVPSLSDILGMDVKEDDIVYGGIVAHNTYINSGLNIGLNFTGGAAVPTNGLAVSGNVGIGTTSPTHNLEVVGTANISGALTTNTSITSPLLTLSGNNAALTFTGTTPSLSSNSSFSIFPQGGNVGIGTSSPLPAALTVQGKGTGTGLTFTTLNSNNSQFGLTVLDNGNVGIGTTSPTQIFQVNPNGSTPFVVTSSGNVGIGVTSPNAGLYLASNTVSNTATANLLIQPSGTGNFSGSSSGTTLGINAASGFTGNLIDAQVAGSSKFLVTSSGDTFIASTSQGIYSPGNNRLNLFVAPDKSYNLTVVQTGMILPGNWSYGWNNQTNAAGTTGADTTIFRDAANIIAQRNGTNAQDFRVYNTYTSGTNYELGNFGWNSNILTIGTEKGSGGGSARNLALETGGTTALTIDTSGNVGIGTSSPNSLLSVAGGAHIGSVRQGISAPTDGLFVDGNVGIGATTSSNKLDVWGNSRISGNLTVDSAGTLGSALIGYSGVTAPSSGLAVSGNLGVGTTSPLQALHVVGQCVAKGTSIKRRRKRKKGKKDEDEWEEVPVEDIKEGDIILSLDERRGEFVPSYVNGLMDKGIQETFRLVTQSGKWIDTTAQHPYLTTDYSSEIERGGTYQVDQSNRIETLSKDTIIALTRKNGSEIPLRVPAGVKKELMQIHKKAGFKGEKRLKTFAPLTFGKAIVALMKSALIIPGKLIIDVEYPQYEQIIIEAIKQYDKSIQVEFKSVGKSSPAHKLAYAFGSKRSWFKKQQKMIAIPFEGTIALLHPEFTGIRSARNHFVSEEYHIPISLSRENNRWVKVKELKPGMMIATLTGWEKIRTIYSTGRQQTFDIEVENTHNFVGNNIVAHNTYINSGLNIGLNFTGGAAVPTNGLAVQGNVGIGTTTANYNLVNTGTSFLNGFVGIGSSLNVTGNVGIGQSLTVGSGVNLQSSLSVTGNTNLSTLNATNIFATSLTTTGNVGVGGSITGFGALSGLNVTGLTNLGNLNANGNVGIGGTATLASNLRLSGQNCSTYANGGKLTTDAFGNVYCAADTNTGSSLSGGVTNMAAIWTSATTLGTGLLFDNGSNVGIGTSAPLARLDVRGAGNGTNLDFLTYGTGSTNQFGLAVLDNGNVGIGNTNPAAQVDILAATSTVGLNLAGSALNSTSSGNGSNSFSIITALGATGQATSDTTGNKHGGTGGAFSFTGGNGGDYTGVGTDALDRGGIGGAFVIAGGTGGNATASTGNAQGGLGGNLSLTSGTGGVSSCGCQSGSGGTISLTGGHGGANSNASGTSGSGGSLIIDAGIPGAASGGAATGTYGTITLGASNASGITIGNTSHLTSATTLQSVANNTTTNSAFVLTNGTMTTGTLAYLTSSSVTTGKLLDIADTGNAWTGNGTTNGLINLASSSTAGAASASNILLNLSRSGTNTNSSVTSYGLYSNVTNTGTTSTNVAGYFSASGGTTANYGLIVANGNVGVGTTSPDYTFKTQGTGFFSGFVGIGSSANISGNVGVGQSLTVTSGTSLSSSLAVTGNTNLSTLNTSGNVGLGASLTVKSGVSLLSSLNISGNTNLSSLNASDNVGVGGSITLTAANNLITTINNNNLNLSAGTGNVVIGSGTGKLDAGTVDPPYVIDGVRYATYLPSMTGVKEETAGVVELSKDSTTGNYQSILDFGNSEKGSDLWLFKSVTDWGTGMKNLIILLSSSGGSKVWYQKDPTNHRVIIYGNCACEVSYRLTAPRFDFNNWPNITKDQISGGFLPNDINDTYTSDGEASASATPNDPFAQVTFDDAGNLVIPNLSLKSLVIPIDLTTKLNNLANLLNLPAINSLADALSTLTTAANTTLAKVNDLQSQVLGIVSLQASQSARLADVSSNVASQSATLTALQAQIASLSAVISNASEKSLSRAESRDSTSSGEIATASATLTQQDLTPPETLFATQSATIRNLNVQSDATVSGTLTTDEARISDELTVLGDSHLSQTSIAGDLNIDGTFSLTNGSELNVIPALHLQSSPLAESADFFNGLVTVDKTGNLQAFGTITTPAIKTNQLTITNAPIASPSATLGASIGTATLPASQTHVSVATTEATDSAKVFITPTSNTDKTLSVTNIKNGHSFDVSILTPTAVDINFNWWIVQTK